MGIIALNGNSSIAQPSGLKEGYVHVMVDKSTITGLQRRMWLAQKKQAVLVFDALSQADYNTINSYIEGGNLITYNNTTTGWSFSGFATSEVAEYWRGASLLRKMTLNLLEQ